MGVIDLLFLAMMIGAIAWGLLSERAHAKGIVAGVLWIVLTVACFLMALLHRGIGLEGRSSEFTEGVVAAVQDLRPFLPYLLVSGTGLALLVVTNGRRQPNPPLQPTRAARPRGLPETAGDGPRG